jgi:hypothetical protein
MRGKVSHHHRHRGGFQLPVTPDPDVDDARTVFTSGGKMVRYERRSEKPIAPQNTTISAVISLDRLSTGEKLFFRWKREEESRRGREMTRVESMNAIEASRGTAHDFSQTALRATVCENPYARSPWPRDLFQGPWDQCYGPVDRGYIRRLCAGQALLDWESLTGEVADFSV